MRRCRLSVARRRDRLRHLVGGTGFYAQRLRRTISTHGSATRIASKLSAATAAERFGTSARHACRRRDLIPLLKHPLREGICREGNAGESIR